MVVDSIMSGDAGGASGQTDGGSGQGTGTTGAEQNGGTQTTNGQGTTNTDTGQTGATGQTGDNGANQGGDKPWYSDLPAEVHEVLKGFKGVGDLVKAYTDAQGKIPKVPTDAKEYDLAALPKGQVEAVGKAFMEAGLTKEQASKVIGLQSAMTQAAVDSAMANGAAQLKQEWGADFDKNVSQANVAVKRFVPPALLQFWQKTGQANSPLIVKMFRDISAAMSEDTLVTGDNGSGKNGLKPADILYPNQGK